METLPINSLDAVFLLVIGLSALIGFFRGFVREVLSLAAWAGAAWLALTFHAHGQALISGMVENQTMAAFVAGGAIFIVSLVILMLVAGFLSRGVQKTSMLGPANRILGLLFGVMRGAVIVAIGYIAAVHLAADPENPEEPKRAWVETSRLLSHVRTVAAGLQRLVPEDWAPPAPDSDPNGEKPQGAKA